LYEWGFRHCGPFFSWELALLLCSWGSALLLCSWVSAWFAFSDFVLASGHSMVFGFWDSGILGSGKRMDRGRYFGFWCFGIAFVSVSLFTRELQRLQFKMGLRSMRHSFVIATSEQLPLDLLPRGWVNVNIIRH
jgi:hypothetical protein